MRWFLLGLTASLLGLCHRYRAPLGPAALGLARDGPGARAWWVADRGADRLVELDAELLIRRTLELAAPVALAHGSDGFSWVVSALQSGPSGIHRLVRLDPSGSVVLEWNLPTVRGLAVTPAGDALVLASFGEHAALWLGRCTGEFEMLADLPGALSMATQGRLTLVAQASGELRVLPCELNPAPVAMTVLEGKPVGVAPGPGGGWWVLEMRRSGARVLALDAELELRHATPVDLVRPVLAGGATEHGLWVLDRDRGRALRVDPASGAIVGDVVLPVEALEAGWSTVDGGVLVASPGVLLRLDAEGELMYGQGGFAHLVAVGRR